MQTSQLVFKDQFFALVRDLQDSICTSLEHFEPNHKFIEDRWERADGGGGWSRVLSGGQTFEKAGVNVSAVHGDLPEVLRGSVPDSATAFYATGVSLVIHPKNPMIPTTHANFRYFEVTDAKGTVVDRWFGGGADLTPYYFFQNDAQHFHLALKEACDGHNEEYYPKFKVWCDNYFFNAHRKEHRGIGGIFFDHLRPDESTSLDQLFAFMQDVGSSFISAYIPILVRRISMEYTTEQKQWQEIRRGRYVEFNLIHDRGTLFGLKTGGRIESILMSLPPTVRWEYDHHPEAGTPEEELVEVLKHPQNWLSYVS
ncbi:MAG: oxygen-dependent coproporphyrinogen oxidase [Schleiferiaceae bacterium]